MIRLRKKLSLTLLSFGSLFFIIGLLLAYADRSVFRADPFANRVAHSLDEPEVAEFLASKITDAVIGEVEDLIAVRPVILAAVRAIVPSDAFQAVVKTAAETTHRIFFTESGEAVLLTLSDLGILIRDTLEHEHPQIASKLPKAVRLPMDQLVGPDVFSNRILRIVRDVSHVSRYSFLLATFGFVLLLAAAIFSLPPLLAMLSLGSALIASSISIYIAREMGGFLVAETFARGLEISRVYQGIWNSFMEGLWGWILALVYAGCILIAIPFAIAYRGDWTAIFKEARSRLLSAAKKAWMGVLFALFWLGFGTFLLLHPTIVLKAAAALLGLATAFIGLVELVFILLYRFMERRKTTKEEIFSLFPSQLRWVALISLVTLSTMLLGRLFLPETVQALTSRGGACNGMSRLCDRPLNRVVFPTTHNSMAAGDAPGWLFPNQERGIQQQLLDGIRALMIDVHYGYALASGVVITELKDEARARAKFEAVVGKEGLEAALRIRNRHLGEPKGDRELYLCHGFCEAGATSLKESFEGITDFLERYPDEVLVIVIEDHEIDADDLKRVIEKSGLEKFIYRGRVSEPFPTLRGMIASGERVLIGAENGGGEFPWYHSFYRGIIQETRFQFESMAEFTCAPLRGDRKGSIFLLNHWITSPPAALPSRAAIVNSEAVLMQRALECQKKRGMLPNLVAVDFYRTGDLFQVTDQLNQWEKR